MLNKRQRAVVRLLCQCRATLLLIDKQVGFTSLVDMAAWEKLGLGNLTKRDISRLTDLGYLVPTGNTNTTRFYQLNERASPAQR